MQIMWLKLKGYRRFKDEAILNLSGKLIALLGPNEAGKTSILKALESLNTDSVIHKDDAYKTSDDNPEETYLKARFILTSEEIKEAKLLGSPKLEVHKSDKGARELKIIPEAEQRDRSRRTEMVSLMTKILKNEKFIEKINAAEPNSIQKFNQYFKTISSIEENLAIPQLNQQGQNCLGVLKLIEIDSLDDNIKSLDTSIQELLELEKTPNPTEYAKSILKNKVPKFLLFGDDDRQLKYEYPVAELQKPSKSLKTLASLAELDLKILSQAINDKNSSRISGLLSKANENLKGVFEGKWSQSLLEVKLEVNMGNLEILLHEGDHQYSELKFRSDGFRQFLSLIAFASLKKNEDVVLLVDEIELHLHYDGQADLLQTLAKQDFAKKVIYSTHSVGCFPEDLGGIKVIERTPDSFTSLIENKFWTMGNGFAPLLPKIGAQQLAFLPLRNSIVVEGAMDMLLLPVIFKEVINQDYLGFLMVQGLSEHSLGQISYLESNGSKVIYLTDCDNEGKKFKKELMKNGVEETRIFNLPGELDKDIVTLEDLLSRECLTDAFNSLLDRYYPDEPKITTSDISITNKVSSLDTLAKSRGMKDYKVALAYEVISLITEEPSMKIADERYSADLKGLYDGIIKAVSSSLLNE